MNSDLPNISSEFRSAVQRLQTRRAEELGSLRGNSDIAFAELVDLCRTEGLFNLVQNTDYRAATTLLSTSVMIEELSTIDTTVGFLAMNDYLCGRVSMLITDEAIRARIQYQFDQSPHRFWFLCQPDAAGWYQVIAPAVEVSSIMVLAPRYHDSQETGFLRIVNIERISDTVSVPLGGLDGLYCRRLSYEELLRASDDAVWHCKAAQQEHIHGYVELEYGLLLCSIVIGVLRNALDCVIEHNRERRPSGKPIFRQQAVNLRLAEIGLALESSQLMLVEATTSSGARRIELGAAAGECCRDLVWNAILQVAQLLGGRGYLESHPAERWIRDVECIRSFFPIRTNHN